MASYIQNPAISTANVGVLSHVEVNDVEARDANFDGVPVVWVKPGAAAISGLVFPSFDLVNDPPSVEYNVVFKVRAWDLRPNVSDDAKIDAAYLTIVWNDGTTTVGNKRREIVFSDADWTEVRDVPPVRTPATFPTGRVVRRIELTLVSGNDNRAPYMVQDVRMNHGTY